MIPNNKYHNLSPPLRNPRPEAVRFEEAIKAILPTISPNEAANILRRILEKLAAPPGKGQL